MKEILTGILVLTGAVIVLIASLGIVRFRDLYSRTHVVTKVSSFAMLLLLIAVNLHFMSVRVLVITIIVFHVVVVLAPVGAHVISKVNKIIDEGSDQGN